MDLPEVISRVTVLTLVLLMLQMCPQTFFMVRILAATAVHAAGHVSMLCSLHAVIRHVSKWRVPILAVICCGVMSQSH